MKHELKEHKDGEFICTCGFQASTEGSMIIHCSNNNDSFEMKEKE